MEGKDKPMDEVISVGNSGYENFNIKHDPDMKFWSSLRKRVAHGPAVKIRDGYADRRRMPRS